MKILTDSHEVEASENSEIKFQLLGNVGEFSLSFTSVNKLNVKPVSLSFDIKKAFEEPEEAYLSEEPVVESLTAYSASNSELTDKLISKLKTPLWFIFGVLVLILIK